MSPLSPIPDFHHFISNPALIQAIYDMGIDAPTRLMAQSVCLLTARSPIGVVVHAPDGSGKTMAAICSLLEVTNANLEQVQSVYLSSTTDAARAAFNIAHRLNNIGLSISQLVDPSDRCQPGSQILIGTRSRFVSTRIDISYVRLIVLDGGFDGDSGPATVEAIVKRAGLRIPQIGFFSSSFSAAWIRQITDWCPNCRRCFHNEMRHRVWEAQSDDVWDILPQFFRVEGDQKALIFVSGDDDRDRLHEQLAEFGDNIVVVNDADLEPFDARSAPVVFSIGKVEASVYETRAVRAESDGQVISLMDPEDADEYRHAFGIEIDLMGGGVPSLFGSRNAGLIGQFDRAFADFLASGTADGTVVESVLRDPVSFPFILMDGAHPLSSRAHNFRFAAGFTRLSDMANNLQTERLQSLFRARLSQVLHVEGDYRNTVHHARSLVLLFLFSSVFEARKSSDFLIQLFGHISSGLSDSVALYFFRCTAQRRELASYLLRISKGILEAKARTPSFDSKVARSFYEVLPVMSFICRLHYANAQTVAPISDAEFKCPELAEKLDCRDETDSVLNSAVSYLTFHPVLPFQWKCGALGVFQGRSHPLSPFVIDEAAREMPRIDHSDLPTMFRWLVAPETGLFERVGDGACWFRRDNRDVLFRQVGRILGSAAWGLCTLPEAHFARAVYTKLVGAPLGLSDLADVDPDRARTAQQVVDDRDRCIDISRREPPFSKYGQEFQVTNENVDEWIRNLVGERLEASVERQFGALCDGFQEVNDGNFFSCFTPDELAALIAGHDPTT